MKTVISAITISSLLLSGVACSAKQQSSVGIKEIKTEVQRHSYMVGQDIGQSLKRLETDLDLNAIYQGIKDALNDAKGLLTEEQLTEAQQQFSQKLQSQGEAKQKNAGDKNKKEGETFLEKNKSADGVVTTASGLQYIVIKEGNGPKATASDKVKVHYEGTLLDGTVFDSSVKRGEPVTFPVTGVIPGWTEALQLMNVGSKYKLFIPSELAYGERSAGPQITPNSTLIFEVELLGIEK